MSIITGEGVSVTPVDGNALLSAQEAAENPITTSTTTSTPTATGSLLDATGGTTSPTSPTSTDNPWALNEKGEFSEGWLDRLPPEFAQDKQILGQFKNNEALAKSYINLQRLMGKKADAIIMPNEKSSPEEWAAFNAKRGVPESADKYPTKVDGIPEGVTLDPNVIKGFNEVAHKNGLTPSQASEAVKYYATLEAARAQEQAQVLQKEYTEGQKALEQAWGDKYETNMAVVKRACQVTGLDPNSKGLSDPNIIVALERFSRMVSDDKIVSSDSTATFMAGQARGIDIMRNPQNPYHTRFVAGDREVVSMVADLIKNG